MKSLKCTIIGNSVALRVRPPQQSPSNINYNSFLKELLLKEFSEYKTEVENKGVGAFTTYNAFNNIDNYIQTFPNFFVINLGVVDASTREIPLWFYRLAQSKKNRFINKFSNALYRSIIIKFRPTLVKIRGKRSWMSKRKFSKYYSLLVRELLKETNAQIIALPINLANNRIEKALPGSRKKHEQYNQIMKNIVHKNVQSFIDLSFLNSEEHYPDGVHYSKIGHEIVAGEILKEIKKLLNK